MLREFADVEVGRYRNFRRHREPVLRGEGRTTLNEKKSLIGARGANALTETAVVCDNAQIFGQEANDIASIKNQMSGALVQLRQILGERWCARIIKALNS